MRFGVDATGWINRRGFGRFTRNAVTRLVEIDENAEYVLLADPATADAGLPPQATIRLLDTHQPPAEAARDRSARSIADLLKVMRAVRREALDAVLFPSLHTWFPFPGAPTVVGVHDTIADDFPELVLPRRLEQARWQLKQRLAIRGARRVFAVSEASQTQVESHFKLPRDSVRIVPEAPDPVFSPRSPDEVAVARAAIGAPERYLLFAGGISPHKDVTGLVDAYADLCYRLPDAPVLVLVGALEDETFASAAGAVRKRITAHGLDGRVLLPGFVSDAILASLYSGSVAFVSPSLAEGFGLPAVEAAACGSALVLSDLPSHRESIGDAALFVPPGDTKSLTDALLSVVSQEPLRRSLGDRARAQVATLSWDRAALALAELLREAARR